MKNARNNRQTQVKNCLKWTASGLLLALLFVLVFAGTLSGAFGIENELQQNGIIQSNVASAAGNSASTNSNSITANNLDYLSALKKTDYVNNWSTGKTFTIDNLVQSNLAYTLYWWNNELAFSNASVAPEANGSSFIMSTNKTSDRNYEDRCQRLITYLSIQLPTPLINLISNGSCVVTAKATFTYTKDDDQFVSMTVIEGAERLTAYSSERRESGNDTVTHNSWLDTGQSAEMEKSKTLSSNTKFITLAFYSRVRTNWARSIGLKWSDISLKFQSAVATDTDAPGINQSGLGQNKFIFSDQNSGLYQIYSKYNNGTYTEITSSCSLTVDKKNGNILYQTIGLYDFLAIDNYGNIKEESYYVAYDANDKELNIKNRTDFDGFSLIISTKKTNFANRTFKIVPDANDPNQNITKYGLVAGTYIDMLATNYTPGGYYDYGAGLAGSFQGTLDGNGCSIINLNIKLASNQARAGLIGTLDGNGCIKNLTIRSGSIDTTDRNDAGAFVGYLNSANARIENCVNYASVGGDGNNAEQVGGICSNIGSKGGTITGCKNYGTVKGKAIVGGIVGFVQGAAKVEHCYNQGDVTSTATSTNTDVYSSAGGYVGGIAGISYGSVRYCFSKGNVTSQSGGFAAGIAAAIHADATTEYCYTMAIVGGNGTTTGIGKVVGHTFKEGQSAASNTSTCWGFFDNLPNNGDNIGSVADGKYTRGLAAITTNDLSTIKPQVIGGGVVTEYEWENITLQSINGFELSFNVSKGFFIEAKQVYKDVSGNKKYSETVFDGAAITSNTVNGTLSISMVFEASFYGSSVAYYDSANTQPLMGFSAQEKSIDEENIIQPQNPIGRQQNNDYKNTTIYGQNAIATYTTKDSNGYALIKVYTVSSLDAELGAASDVNYKAGYSDKNYTLTTATFDVGNYFYLVEFLAGDGNTLLGYAVIEHTIEQQRITVQNTWTGYSEGTQTNVYEFIYNGNHQGVIDNGIAIVSELGNFTFSTNDYTIGSYVATVNASDDNYSRVFTLLDTNNFVIYSQESFVGTIKLANTYGVSKNDNVVTYTWSIAQKQITIGQSSFYYGTNIEQRLTDGTVFQNLVYGHSVVVNIDYNFYERNISSNNYPIEVGNIVVNDGSGQPVTGNYTVPSVTITVLAGDFWSNGTTDIANNLWGSQNNPYVIGTKDQLTRLSAIVGGTSAVNSIKNDTYVYVQAQSGNYSNAYFKLANDIGGVGNITPIGVNTHSFAGNFDGNYKTISGLNISVAGNNVGLFGYISGATIKYLTVNGSVKGSSNVGGVVGYALNSTIENVTNNASVSSTTDKYVDYSIVRYHAHIPNSLEGVENINDRNINTKYCTSSYGAMSFVIEVPTGTFLTGFTIQNADDTNNNQKRTPKEVYIWGSNVKPTLGNNTSETPYGKSPSDSGQQGWELFYENDNIGLPSTNSTKQAYAFNQEYNYKYYWIRVVGKNKQIQFAEFEVLTQGGSVGGVVGYAKNTSIEGATNTATVNAGSNVGGIVGEFNSLGKSVSGAANSGAITSSNTAAGIVGKLTEGSISGSKNTGRVTASVATIIDGETGAFLGGIAGWANGNVNKCYNEGEITTVTSSWGHSNIVGGIVGFLVNGKTVSYCYNSGNVVGSDNIGGIVGINNGTVSYCYQDGALNDLYLGTSPSNFITSNGGAIEHCWILPGASQTGFNQDTIPNGRKLEVGQDKYKPATVGDYQTFDWQNILTVEINGFRVQESVNPNQNQFFESKKGSNSTTYLTPNKTENINQANALNRDNTASFTVTAWYDANTASDIYCAVNTIAINTSADTYNNAQLGFTRSDVTTPGTSGSVYGIVFDYKGKNPNENFVCAFDSNGNIVAGSTNPTQVDTYNTTVFVKIGDIVVGKMIAVDYAINKATLDVGWEWTDNSHKNRYDRTGNGDKVLFVYNGKEQGLMSVSLGNTALFDVTGDKLTNTDAATYTRTYTLIDTRNYKLNFTNDNTGLTESATSVEFKWTIRKNKLTVVNRWVAEDFGKDSNLYTFEYNTKHRGLLTTNYAITFFQEKATDNTKPELKQGTDYTISEHQNAISVGEYSRIVTILNNNYEVGDTNAYVDVGSSITATVDKGISVNGLVVTYTWKIVPFDLAANFNKNNVWFGGTTNLIVGNQNTANVKVGNTNKGYYPLQADKKGTGVQQVLVYAQHNYAADKFVLYVKYNNGIVAELEQGTDKEYTVGTLDIITNTFGTFNVNVVSQANPVEDTNVTARGTGNFSGDITKYYTALYSDFGWKVGKTPEDNDWGGSADNPYVISKPEHLLRLSQIVNGGTAWNSIQNTVTAGLCIAPQGTAFATDRAYSGAYFLVAADIDNIDMTGNVSTDGVYNFLPIGHRNEQSQTDMPFSGTFDGNGKAITFVYNTENFGNGARVDYVGLFGYLNGATVTDLIAKSIQVNGIKGRNYVGGIVGYAENSHLVNVQKSYGDGVVGENYVGGVVGYAENTLISCNNDTITECNVTGAEYVGGIVGKWIVTEQTQIGGSDDGQARITPGGRNHIIGTKYVGGLFGWLDMSGCEQSMIFKPQFFNEGLPLSVTGTEYVGALFGVVVGNGYHQSATQGKYTAIVISDQKVNNITLQTNTNAKVVGGLVGYAESVGILFETDWNTSSMTFTLDDSTSFFGGVVGVLGKNSTIEAIIVTKEGDGSYLTGSEHTILNNTALGASGKPIGSFVGGIVGYVSSQAGTYWEANTTIFGNGISLVNSGQIHATGYAGGIFGALGDLSTSVAQTFENDTNSILYNVLTTGVRSGNANTTLGIAPTVDSAYFIGAKGKLVNSASLSVTDGYVGGIAGYSGAKVRFVLRNTPQTGAFATENLNVYSGGNDIYINGSYAGGIAGYLVDNLEHELQYIVVQAKFDSANAKRVGGLVGYMGSGKVENCVVTNGGNSNVNELTDTFKGSEYVGGLVGETQNAIITNSVSTGFNLDKTTNTKGGLLGGGTNPTIESSWTFYIANSGAKYSTVSKNTYGKYILVDTDIVTTNGSSYPTFAKLCEFTGITENGTAGVLEFAVNMPRYDLNVNLKNKQLAFYDASGSDTVSTNFDSGAVNGFENKVKEIENINNVVTTKLDMASGTSMQICVVKIEFVNISKWNSTNPLYNTADGAQQNVENAYKKPSNSSRYVVDVTNNNDGTIATNPKRIYDDDGNTRYILANVYFNWQATDGTVRYVPIGSSNADYVSDRIGTYDSGDITPGIDAENPLTISNQKEWNDFAWSIYTGANDYAGQYVKLLTSDVVIDNEAHYGTASGTTPLDFSTTCTPNNSQEDTKNATSNMGYNFAGNITQGSSKVEQIKLGTSTALSAKTPSFKGHFDGNGHTITIYYDSGGYHRVSVFPNASNATFQNLTIDGYIYSGNSSNNSGYDIAAFVSKASGKIELYNCTNYAVIQGFRNAAGFTGYIGSHEIVIKGCVNNGSVTTYETPDNSDTYRPKYYNYGTGGIVACSNRSITIESCINNGRIVAPVNVGGIIGRVSGKHVEDNVESESKLYLYNCANTGEVYSNFKLSDEQASAFWSSKKYYGNSIWCNAGGLVGFVTKSASLHAFACYNSGYVHGVGNVVGGIVGTIGDHNGILYRTPNTRAKFPSEIVYCYNTGVVEVGYNGVNEENGVNIWGTDGDKYCSSVVGGIVGVIANGSIKYCYNTGTIECWGGVGIKGAYHSRAGGIVGESTANSQADSSWTRYVGIINCYNVGKVNVYTNEQARYSSGLLGYMDDNAISNSHVENSFTIKDAVYKKTNNKYYDVYAEGSVADPNKSNGGSPIALVDFTAVRKSDGTVAPIGSFAETHKASLETLTNDSAYYAGTAAGYVYLPGCLPQLAVFALDTHNGLSMRSVNYGQNIYGDYVEQKAGDKYSPFIIKDGIDLLGLQALVDLGYTFEGKFVEFANETNNIKNDGTNEPMISSIINMPLHQNNTQKIESSEGAYKSSTLDGNFTQTGKNYHLFAIGAVCSDGINTSANSAYTTWLSRNYYYKQDSQTMAQGATFATVNFLPIGRNGKVFKGSISGKQENNANTVINNLRITSGQTTGGAYGGLFGHIDNAYIGYIEVGGESNIWAYSSDNQQIAATGAIAGYVTGDSVIEHCAVSGTTAIGAYGKNDDTHIASDITYAGGIVGLANPKKGTQYEAGISTIIKDCTVNIISLTTGDRAAFAGIIQACKSNIGGVLGYVGGDAGASGKGNTVRIEGCSVDKAVIQAASSANTSSQIGGILGYGSQYVAAFITGCKVGVGGTVSIKGEHSLGGIAGGMSNAKGGYIDSCIVGANTTIERINQGGGNISENPKHGTAIGGLVGFTEDSTDTTIPLTTTFSGTSAFSGKINVTVGTTNPGEHGDKKPVGNVGGIVGDMGSGANFASGSDVTVDGTINIALAAANVGGVAGRTSNATFIGKFDVSPTMNTLQAENVGGFIGKNVGTVYILADTTERIVDGKLNGTNIIIGGTIKGTSEVGGFIGVNNSGSSLNIGSNVANAKPYKSGTLSITIAEGAEISGSGNHVGGIVGKNEGADGGASYASIDIVKGTITQQGTINGANNVGGIIGLNQGLLTTGGGEADTSIGGIALSDDQIGLIKNLSITNIGNVTGSGNYVGGVVGKLDSPATLRTEDSGKGAIAGTFTNNGTVDGNSFVGGSLGFVGKNVTITAKNNVATLFVNDGEVNATGYFVGGSIGALVGKIQGENSSVAVKFENKKKVNATGFVGGSIGVLAGPVSYAQFVNSSGDLTIAAVNSVGGSVGYIGVPSPLSDELVGFTAHQININNTHFEASGNLTANPSQDAINAAKKDKEDNGWGGAIGVMGAAIKSWTDNTYYANGNVSANGIYNVGGIVGLINAGNITISNMLAHRTTVTGGKNVGGIVGATTGAKTVINSAYAIEGTFSATSATKGAGDNVGGIIGLAKDDTDASTSYWVKGYANSDIATYDVKDLSKLGFTTGKATTGWFFLYANDADGTNGLGTINTNHQGGGENELKYWKRIANAYTAQERANGDDKKDLVPSSNIVSGGQPKYATLYATATAATVTPNGYYMYTATSNTQVTPTVVYDEQNKLYHISVKTNSEITGKDQQKAENVAVFYRSVSSAKEALTYNGYLRNAITGLDGVELYATPIADNTTPTIKGKENKYIYTATTSIIDNGTTTTLTEAQSNPNIYTSEVKIYYVDENGVARLVGGNSELNWEIKARDLEVTFEKNTERTYGADEGNTVDMKVSINNIAPKRGLEVRLKITVTFGDESVAFQWNGTDFDNPTEAHGITIKTKSLTSNGTLDKKDKDSTSEDITDENTYQLICELFFKQAKKYSVTVSDESKPKACYNINNPTADFLVKPAKLDITGVGTGSFTFDNNLHGYEWKVEGFKYNENMSVLAAFKPCFNNVENKLYTAQGLIDGSKKVTVNGADMSIDYGNKKFVLSNAKHKGAYFVKFENLTAGNYTLNLVGGDTNKKETNHFVISENALKFEWSQGNYTHTYNGSQTGKFSVTISTTNGVIDKFGEFISKYYTWTISNSDKKPTYSISSGQNSSITISFETGVNANKYTASIDFNKDPEAEKFRKENEANCTVHSPESKSYTINKRPLTLTTTMTGTSPYIYNTSHQGLDKVSLNQGTSTDNVGLLQDDSVKINISGSVSKTLTFKNTYTQSAGISTIDAGTYSVSFALSGNNNYTLSVSPTSKTEWTINQYVVKVGNLNVGTDKVYDARAVVPTISIEGMSGDGKTFTYHNDTVTISYSITKVGGTSYSGNKLVNAGQYTISIGGTNSGSIKANRTGTSTDTSKNYTFGNTTQNATYTIAPCPIEIVWEMKTFVYNASNQMLSISGIKIGENDTVVAAFSADKVKGLGDDTLVFNRTGGGTDVGVNHTTTAELASVSGTNDEVPSIRENYTIKAGATSGVFAITPFVVNISFNTSAGAILNKVYNANDVVPQNQIKDSYFTWSKISGTNLPSSNPFTITGKYDDENVGTGKGVTFTYTFTDPSGKGNYKAGTRDTAQHNVGQITPAHIKVALDKLRSGKATRTFTNEPYYGGKDGASGGEKDGKSTVYRSGEGFRISGVFGNDDIKVVAKYAEAGDDRAMFDKYVNDIVKIDENTFAKAAAGTHLKMLVFEMTGGDATNYTFNVYDTSDKAYSKNNGDSQTPVNVYDKDDEKNNKDKLSQIKIEITVKTYKVEYTNAAQSYANADNTYNTNWERVGVSNNPPGVTVTVSNGWMFADGQDHGDDEQAEKKVYKAYTTIRGSQNSVRLGAKISGIDGMELNYKMVNQPILTIGYFVVDNNDVFEIGSASSLMIASYYWWVAQNGQNPDFNLPLVATSTWHKIVSNDDYMTKPFEKPSDVPNDVDMTGWDWDMYFAWFEQQYNVKIFLNETGISNEDGTWGYYTTGEESQQTQYKKYRMVRDFSGKLSESDIAILEAFFPKEKGWGVGKTYLDNFLNTSVGSVLTAVGSVFRWYNGSVGQFEFDGNGYVIEYLNIMGYDKENVGLFDIIGANGIVKNLHLRNITINANKGNVGGIAGSIAAADGDADATKNVTNVSFHGKITASGGTVGGLFGTSARAIDRAIVLGEISATNANVGGVVGTATADLTKVVSMMQITASGGTVGEFTSDNAHVGENCTHMTNAVWKRGTGFVNVKDKNVEYNALMLGSNSLYANAASAVGTYDVISETFADSGQNVNPRQSKRLRDMVSVYLLMYSLSVNGEKYTISASSWLVGTADGTTAKPIVIANKQNVSLLRELRFAAFVLKANVSIDIASTFSGAFYGSVTSAVNESGESYDYKITCNKPMFEAYATEPTAWLVTPTQP